MSYERQLERQWRILTEECEWHEGEPKFGCPVCAEEAEAAQPDTVKEAEGWA